MRRYRGIIFDKSAHTPPVGTPYRLHHIFPAPVFQEPINWWKRLPRLGQVYSLGNLLEHPNLLLICAIRLGNRALHERLEVLLDHTNLLGERAFDIAKSFGTSTLTDDDQIFLIAHLLLCHHWFFPLIPSR